MKYRNMYLIFLSVVLLSGCQLDMKRSVEDYTGSDAAKIRVLDKGKLSLTFYERDGDCYKEVESRKLTSAFHLSLLSTADYSTGFAKKINMQSPSSFGSEKVKEYAIKPGQHIMIVSSMSESDHYGNNVNHEKRSSFIPEKNHEYEISVNDPQYLKSAGEIVISDLTTHGNIKGWQDKICKKSGFFQ